MMVNVGEYDVAKSTLALQNSRFDPNACNVYDPDVLPTCPFSEEYTADDVGGAHQRAISSLHGGLRTPPGAIPPLYRKKFQHLMKNAAKRCSTSREHRGKSF